MIRSVFWVTAFIMGFSTQALGFDYKQVKDFKPLSAYPDVAAFEKVYGDYVQHCLDHTNGGLQGLPCLIGAKLWDRELNRYYRELEAVLSADEKALLLTSQRAWLKTRDASEKFSDALLQTIYPQPGTMYQLMSASDADDTLSAIIKSRTLLLKRWLESMQNN